MMQPTNLILAAGLLVSLALIAGLSFVLIRLRLQGQNGTAYPVRSQRKHAPLENLEPKDISFLTEHPALTRTFIRELRRERRNQCGYYSIVGFDGGNVDALAPPSAALVWPPDNCADHPVRKRAADHCPD